jgi:hypothetical protein
MMAQLVMHPWVNIFALRMTALGELREGLLDYQQKDAIGGAAG